MLRFNLLLVSKLKTTLPAALAGATLLLLAACTSTQTDADRIRDQLLNAKPGDTIVIPSGIYEFKRSLSLDVDNVTIKGNSMSDTILSFKNQVSGAEGLLVTASNFTIEDIAIEDTVGDALKINEGNNIIVRRVRTEWTGGPDTNNGAYGIYPVQTENTLVEDSVAIGASDAGIYVGQSRRVIVRGCLAEFNVAGIEIENTVDADVYENVARLNTGGILVFNMPQLELEGKRTRIFNNQIINNNTPNFGKPGTAVASVPAGSGISINSNDQVEVFDNLMVNNQTAHIVISSLYSTNYADSDAMDNFDPYPETIYIHNNEYEGGGNAPDTDYLPMLKQAMFGEEGNFPPVIWDGFVNEALMTDGQLPAKLQICIAYEMGADVLNVDAPNEFANPQVVPHECQHEPLPGVELASFN